MDYTYEITGLTQRINRRLSKLIPYSKLIWDYTKQNYFLHIYSEPRQVIGPVYHKDLLPFSTFINVWKMHERGAHKTLNTNHGPEQECRLRTDLRIHLVTAFEKSYLERRRPGQPFEKEPFVPNVPDQENIEELQAQIDALMDA